MEGNGEKVAICESEGLSPGTKSATTLILDFLVFRSVRHECWLNRLVYGNLS